MKKVTREEAIELLKPSGTKDQTYYEKKFDAACEIAVKDMEKQIPKKPKEYEDKYYACPTCEKAVMRKWVRYPDMPMDRAWGLRYCFECGQALNWEEEE